MYVHIGNDTVINSEEIIAILDIKALEKKDSLENVCKNLKISDNIIDVSEGNKKTLIVMQGKNKNRGYISNIYSITLGKRTSKYERMDK